MPSLMSTLALAGLLREAKPAIEARLGGALEIAFAPTRALLARIAAGERADAALLTAEAVRELCAGGVLAAATARDLALSRIGLAVPRGAARPNISTLAEEVNAKALVIPEGFTGQRLLSGEAALAIQQVSELMEVEGIDIVGPLPEGAQAEAVFSGAAFAGAAQGAAAMRAVAAACTPEALRRNGLDLPAPG